MEHFKYEHIICKIKRSSQHINRN